jgi:hypothetical protein
MLLTLPRGTIVNNASRKRKIGIGAAWLAAYALALNVILSAALSAAVSPLSFAAGHILCANSADIHTVRDEADKTDNHAAVRCPLCIGNHHPVALPPPSAPIVERGLSHTTSVGMLDGVFVALARISDHRARGPPLLT